MTYCIGLYMDDGLVMLADTRTNAGVDNISTFRKLTIWEEPGDRVMALMTAGNLAVSQAVVNLLHEGIEFCDMSKSKDCARETLLTVPSMFQAAQLVGAAVREVYKTDGEALQAQSAKFDVSMILGGQIKGRRMRLFQIYSAGNFIEATPDTPFFQIGENKYGKPILDRAFTYKTDLPTAVKLSFVSMDSTLRSNMSVGMPLDMMVYKKDSIQVEARRRIEPDDKYFSSISQVWGSHLREAQASLPNPPWLNGGTR